MDREWNDSQPIYRQLRDRVVAMILEGALQEGDPLPSVRTVAAEYRVNPLTVLKGYQELVDEGLVEARRGRGMFVRTGVYELLLASERRRFLEEEWPRVRERVQRLRLWPRDLFGPDAKDQREGEAAPPAAGVEPKATKKTEGEK
jgi:GntR family transcriptional regulator